MPHRFRRAKVQKEPFQKRFGSKRFLGFWQTTVDQNHAFNHGPSFLKLGCNLQGDGATERPTSKSVGPLGLDPSQFLQIVACETFQIGFVRFADCSDWRLNSENPMGTAKFHRQRLVARDVSADGVDKEDRPAETFGLKWDDSGSRYFLLLIQNVTDCADRGAT